MDKIDLSEFIRKMNDINKVLNSVHIEVASVAVSFSKDRFREQSWLDTSRTDWKKRRAKRKGGKNRSQTLLVDTGRLKRSVRKIYSDKDVVIIGTDVPYAQIHNDGGKINKSVTVKAHTRGRFGMVKKGTGVYNIRTRGERTRSVRERTGDIQVKTHTRKMNTTIPARKFIGESGRLSRRITTLITIRLQKAIGDESTS